MSDPVWHADSKPSFHRAAFTEGTGHQIANVVDALTTEADESTGADNAGTVSLAVTLITGLRVWALNAETGIINTVAILTALVRRAGNVRATADATTRYRLSLDTAILCSITLDSVTWIGLTSPIEAHRFALTTGLVAAIIHAFTLKAPLT